MKEKTQDNYDILKDYLNYDFFLFSHSSLHIPTIIKVVEKLISYGYTKPIKIVVVTDSLRKIFIKIFENKINYEIIPIIFEKKSNKIYSYINKLIILSDLYKKHFSHGNIAAIFAINFYIKYEFYILSRLKKDKRNKLFFIRYVGYNYPQYNSTLWQKISSLQLIFYGKYLKFSNLENKKNVLMILDKFFNDEIIIINEPTKFLNQIPIPEKYKIELHKKVIFFIDLAPYLQIYYDYHKWKSLIEEILDYILKLGLARSDIGLKFHPRHDKEIHFQDKAEIIDSYITSELLNLNNCNLLISTNSAALCQEYHKNMIKISLINLVEWIKPDNKKYYLDYLLRYNVGNLYIPETKYELFNLIDKALKKTENFD